MFRLTPEEFVGIYDLLLEEDGYHHATHLHDLRQKMKDHIIKLMSEKEVTEQDRNQFKAWYNLQQQKIETKKTMSAKTEKLTSRIQELDDLIQNSTLIESLQRLYVTERTTLLKELNELISVSSKQILKG